nr:hypothetical protein Itr_chr12CG16830 [Ipomoea trifida]
MSSYFPVSGVATTRADSMRRAGVVEFFPCVSKGAWRSRVTASSSPFIPSGVKQGSDVLHPSLRAEAPAGSLPCFDEDRRERSAAER